METHLRQRRGVVILELRGRMVAGQDHESLLVAAEEQIDAGRRSLLLDLSQVTVIDSSGIGDLVATHLMATREGGQVHLLRPSSRVKAVLEMAKLQDLIPTHEDEESALRALGG